MKFSIFKKLETIECNEMENVPKRKDGIRNKFSPKKMETNSDICDKKISDIKNNKMEYVPKINIV